MPRGEPIRVDVRAFVPSGSSGGSGPRATRASRSAWARSRSTTSGWPSNFATDRSVSSTRAPAHRRIGYEAFLASSCVDGFEIRYVVDGELAAVAIMIAAHDRCRRSTRTGPSHSALSLGTYSILTQIEFARRAGLDWVDLGSRSRRTTRWRTSSASSHMSAGSMARGAVSRASRNCPREVVYVSESLQLTTTFVVSLATDGGTR